MKKIVHPAWKPEEFLGESAVGWDARGLRSGLRAVLSSIAARLGISHEESVLYVAARADKSRNTVYAWLSDSPHQSPIPWPLLDLLRMEEAMLCGVADGRPFAGMLRAHDPSWQVQRMRIPVEVAPRRIRRAA